MAKPVLPITLHLGDITAAELGNVELPFVTSPARKEAGQWQVPIRIDHAELHRRIADRLRIAADELDKGASADGQ